MKSLLWIKRSERPNALPYIIKSHNEGKCNIQAYKSRRLCPDSTNCASLMDHMSWGNLFWLSHIICMLNILYLCFHIQNADKLPSRLMNSPKLCNFVYYEYKIVKMNGSNKKVGDASICSNSAVQEKSIFPNYYHKRRAFKYQNHEYSIRNHNVKKWSWPHYLKATFISKFHHYTCKFWTESTFSDK